MKKGIRHKSYQVLLPVWWAMLPFLFFCCKKDDPVTPFVRLLENQKMHSTVFDNDITYAVLLPDGYDQSTVSYPVVYLLHGYGDTEKAWYTSGGLQYYTNQLAGDIVPMIYVMPAAYYSYYVNRFSGDYPYMDMMTSELVPTIDSLFRTIKDKSARGVMGYSMGGYGALILPALNPEIFTVGVPLSMSFRTDEQYMAEPQDIFNSQWGNLFGGFGATGTARLTDYFIQHSPFHFFGTGEPSRFNGLKFLVDCGDDEESLSITNDEMHAVMRDNNIAHEYRVRNGGHSFDYWKKSYPEAFKFMSNAFEKLPHPVEPVPVNIGALIDGGKIELLYVNGVRVNIMTPVDYANSLANFPVLYLIHDYEDGQRAKNLIDVFSLLRNNMISDKLTESIVVEIPVGETENVNYLIEQVVSYMDAGLHRTIREKQGRIILGNDAGGKLASAFISANTDLFGSCFLFSADLPDIPEVAHQATFYYLDITDDDSHYKAYEKLYYQIRKDEIGYQYRVRQGSESYQSFLNGLSESLSSINERL